MSVHLSGDGDRFRITVADDGAGLPENPANPGMGLELVSLLAEQLNCSPRSGAERHRRDMANRRLNRRTRTGGSIAAERSERRVAHKTSRAFR